MFLCASCCHLGQPAQCRAVCYHDMPGRADQSLVWCYISGQRENPVSVSVVNIFKLKSERKIICIFGLLANLLCWMPQNKILSTSLLTVKLAFEFWDNDLGWRSVFCTISLIARAFDWHLLWEDCAPFWFCQQDEQQLSGASRVLSQYVLLTKFPSHTTVAVANRPPETIP